MRWGMHWTWAWLAFDIKDGHGLKVIGSWDLGPVLN